MVVAESEARTPPNLPACAISPQGISVRVDRPECGRAFGILEWSRGGGCRKYTGVRRRKEEGGVVGGSVDANNDSN